MRVEDPVILTCAISGAMAGREVCPAIPYTPADYAAEARRIVDEGGVQIHIHARRPDTGEPSFEVEDFRAITEAIKAEVGDEVIINYSTGAIGVPVEKRIAYLRELRPDVAALNVGTMNYAKFSKKRNDWVFKFEFLNPIDEIVELVTAMRDLGIRPECECFTLGFVSTLQPLIDTGALLEPFTASFVMGVIGGAAGTTRNIQNLADNLPGGAEGPNHWQVIGISRDQWRLVAASLTIGGSIRVGLEDNVHLPDGTMARSNGDLVAKARQMTEDVGRRLATVEEARAVLGCSRCETVA